MKTYKDYEYVQRIPGKRGKPDYHYFRNQLTGERFTLSGKPGSQKFDEAYQKAVRAHAPIQVVPKILRTLGTARGSLKWVIDEYKQRSKEWADAKQSTRDIYDRRHNWLLDNFGSAMIWDFTREQVKGIRDLPHFADKPSVADATVDRLATLWDYAEEFCHLAEMVKLNGVNPARGIKKLSDEDSESAPVWPLELCKLFEEKASADLRKFYFLGRYGGQRRSDLAETAWEHFNFDANAVFVKQIKTSNRIWVPLPERLKGEMQDWSRDGDYVVMSPKKRGEPWKATSITNEMIVTTRALGFSTADSKGNPRYYSPHGLRHLCGIELAHAGASDPQIAAVLGHSTMKQVQTYRAQASQLVLARGAQALRDAMYRQELHDAMVSAATNVTKLRA
ncbi:MAG TPA: tyrosine-type recombinase/integrase [Bradyrhizobium sp.]|nr:tyrosine-type recombinase/integrase [Bradyrhizobium sp.]